MKSVFELMAGNEAWDWDPGVQRTIILNVNVSTKDAIFDAILVWIYGSKCFLGTWSPTDHYFKSTVSKKDAIFDEIRV